MLISVINTTSSLDWHRGETWASIFRLRPRMGVMSPRRLNGIIRAKVSTTSSWRRLHFIKATMWSETRAAAESNGTKANDASTATAAATTPTTSASARNLPSTDEGASTTTARLNATEFISTPAKYSDYWHIDIDRQSHDAVFTSFVQPSVSLTVTTYLMVVVGAWTIGLAIFLLVKKLPGDQL